MFDRNTNDRIVMEQDEDSKDKKISSLGLIEDALKVYAIAFVLVMVC